MQFLSLRAGSLILLASLASGCTRSITAEYEPGLSLTQPIGHAGTKVGVARFIDMRPWVKKDDAKSYSFIAQQGSWKFGLGYAGTDYVPIADFVQRIFVDELKRAGFRSAGFGSHGVSDAKELQDLCNSSHSDYMIGGTLITFEFVNDPHFVTVDSRRTVSIAITVARNSGTPVFENRLYNENNQEGEGMGVLHSTNVDKLVNGPLKQVLAKVITDLSQQMAIRTQDIKLAVNFEGENAAFSVSPDYKLMSSR